MFSVWESGNLGRIYGGKREEGEGGGVENLIVLYLCDIGLEPILVGGAFLERPRGSVLDLHLIGNTIGFLFLDRLAFFMLRD